MVDVQSIATVERQPFIEDVDDVLFGSWPFGALGRERVDVAVDGRQFVVDGEAFMTSMVCWICTTSLSTAYCCRMSDCLIRIRSSVFWQMESTLGVIKL